MSEATGSRLDTAVKLLLICFISLAAFALGAFVGKKVSDSEYRRAQLEQGDFKQLHAESSETPLSDDEVASLTDEFVKKEREASGGAEDEGGYKKMPREVASEEQGKEPSNHDSKTADAKPSEEPAPEGFKADNGDAVHGAAQRVAENKAPVPDPKESRKPDSVYPSVASAAVGKFTVQVASYATEDEARNHAGQLRGKGFSAFYVPASVNGTQWYRVSVGLFTSHSSAAVFQKDLMKQADIKSAIVQKIVK